MDFTQHRTPPATEQKPYKLWLLILMAAATIVGLLKLVRIFFVAYSLRELIFAVAAFAVAVLLFIFSRK